MIDDRSRDRRAPRKPAPLDTLADAAARPDPQDDLLRALGPDRSPDPAAWAISRQRLAAAAAEGCPFARFVMDAGLADDVFDPPVPRGKRRNP